MNLPEDIIFTALPETMLRISELDTMQNMRNIKIKTPGECYVY